MPLRIPVAHDFNCGWCWIGLSQAKRLRAEFGVEFEWLPFEQYPEGEPFDTSRPPCEPPNKPRTPSRMRLALAAEGLDIEPIARPLVRTRLAHQAVELAKELGRADEMVDRLYIAYWRHGLDIGNPEVVRLMAKGLVPDEDLRLALRDLPDAGRIVAFDEEAHREGVYNIPTFFIGDNRFAEQPYSVLRDALRRQLQVTAAVETPYRGLHFPKGEDDRPYTFINMIATIDGKTVSGKRDEPVTDLGSNVDRATMRRLEHEAQAVLIGASTLRATPGLWYPRHLWRFVVSSTGDIDRSTRFFTDAPDRAFVVVPETTSSVADDEIAFGVGRVDFVRLLRHIRLDLGIQTLLVEGGSEVNAQLLAADLVDELFLTIAPKVKLGRAVPTYAGGEPLDREQMPGFHLIESNVVGDEVFLRYRRAR